VPGQFDFESSLDRHGERQLRRRIRHLALALGAVMLVMLGSLVGQARAGGSAAQDQYTPAPVVKPTGGAGAMTPPGAQASAPTAGAVQGGSTLPFTGLSLLKIVLVGVGLLLLGILLRRGVPRRGP
jgi:hypothetical protein